MTRNSKIIIVAAIVLLCVGIAYTYHYGIKYTNSLGTTNKNNMNGIPNKAFQQKYAVFPPDYDIAYISGGNKRYALSDQDIQSGMQILENYLRNNPAIRNLEEYKIQLFGYLNKDNEKIIWANYFCDAHGIDWQNNLVFVHDGGNCFFNVKVNLDKKEIFDFEVNGEA